MLFRHVVKYSVVYNRLYHNELSHNYLIHVIIMISFKFLKFTVCILISDIQVLIYCMTGISTNIYRTTINIFLLISVDLHSWISSESDQFCCTGCTVPVCSYISLRHYISGFYRIFIYNVMMFYKFDRWKLGLSRNVISKSNKR